MLSAWVDGVASTAVSLADRALHYGDAAFTTLRVHGRRPCWIDAHLRRLQDACSGLRLPVPDWGKLRDEIEQTAVLPGCGIVKVLLSRGDGARGYAPRGAHGRRMVFGYPAPLLNADDYRVGVTLGFAALVISQQPRLAGLKHANRLEQVLARAELDERAGAVESMRAQSDISADADVLLCDADDRVISASSANLFACFGSELQTPLLSRAGVAGVCRQQILQSPPAGFSVTVTDMPRAILFQADELFLSNAVRGIVPVRALGDHRYRRTDAARALMHRLHPDLGLPVPE